MLHAVTLLGSSSGRNAGDAALISGIMDPIDEICGRSLLYEIPTIRPSFISNTYRNSVQPISMLPWNVSLKMLGVPTYRSVRSTDLSLIFDAILFDRSLFNPLFNFMSTLYLLLPGVKRAGKKLGMYNVGTGPVTTPLGRKILRELSEMMDFITVRDRDSYDILVDLGVRNPRIVVGADAAIGVRSAPATRVDQILRSLKLNHEKDILGININAYVDTWSGSRRKPVGRETFLAIIAAAIKRVIAQLEVPVLFVSTQHHDVGITEQLIAQIAPAVPYAHLSNRDYDHFEIKGVLGRVSLLFGMRLHAMILGSSVYTPIVGLAYQPKVTHYHNSLGMNDSVLSFNDFSEQSIKELILRGWEQRDVIKQLLRGRIPALIERSRIAAHLVAALDRGHDLDDAITEARVANA